MKKLIALVAVLFVSTVLPASDSTQTPIVDCKCKGIPLYGRVRVVEMAADLDVLVVDMAPADLYVLQVDAAPTKCGEWEFVDLYGEEDFTVRFVDLYGEQDFTVQFVDLAGMEGTR